MAYTEEELKKELETKEYEYGFYTDIESDTLPKGLNEEVVIAISKKKEEPEWMTEWRLEACRAWQKMEEPESITISTATPASFFCSSTEIPNFLKVSSNSGSTSSKLLYFGFLLGAE